MGPVERGAELSAPKITHAMVLAAGLGKRMRPLTENLPKPLIQIGGKTLLDRGLDALGDAGVETAVVNVHYLPDMIVAHTSERSTPEIRISDESGQLLDSAGGIVKALPQLGGGLFFILNADTFWIDEGPSNLDRLRLAWNDESMDILLMLAELDQSTGHNSGGDFEIATDGRLQRAPGQAGSLIYAGAAVVAAKIFAGAKLQPHSLNEYFDTAIAAGRLFGMPMKGRWVTVGTPEAMAPAEQAVLRTSNR